MIHKQHGENSLISVFCINYLIYLTSRELTHIICQGPLNLSCERRKQPLVSVNMQVFSVVFAKESPASPHQEKLLTWGFPTNHKMYSDRIHFDTFIVWSICQELKLCRAVTFIPVWRLGKPGDRHLPAKSNSLNGSTHRGLPDDRRLLWPSQPLQRAVTWDGEAFPAAVTAKFFVEGSFLVPFYI